MTCLVGLNMVQLGSYCHYSCRGLINYTKQKITSMLHINYDSLTIVGKGETAVALVQNIGAY